MIRRISKKNDLKDMIKSCPSGVIDDIYKIQYYIQGYNVYIDAAFSKVGDHLEVILPTSDLETLPNGILMRKAYYKVVDTSYPDGYYNLEFEDNMNIWLGEPEGGIVPPSGDYVTEEELTSTLSSYAAKSWVSSQEFATETWVESQGYIKSIPSDIATQSWVISQGYITSETIPSDIATQSWVSSQGYLSATNFKTVNGESIVGTGDIYFDLVVNIAASELESYGYATKSWVSSQEFITSSSLTGYATQSWVSGQGYITTSALSGYATESWVQSQGYLTSVPSEYATQSWVESQGYLTSVPSEYATQSWVSSNYFATSNIWTGTQSQWEALTSEQQALYTIALVTE
jgi:hypothetical protein